jgi:hypothetical protein
MEWRPIETCPQDGSWFLASVPETHVPICIIPIGPGSDVFESFWDRSYDVHPTHWAPLPAPPYR